jgi:hypothetical protein
MSYNYRGRQPLSGGLVFTAANGLIVILSGEEEREQIGWHFSISHADRNPTWEEQRDARYQLVPDGVYMVQILPPKAEYVNVHKFCFHWHEAGPKFFDTVTGRPKP